MHRDFFMAGMPGSGKTTYLASLWTLLSEGCVSTMYKKEVGVMPEDCATLKKYYPTKTLKEQKSAKK